MGEKEGEIDSMIIDFYLIDTVHTGVRCMALYLPHFLYSCFLVLYTL